MVLFDRYYRFFVKNARLFEFLAQQLQHGWSAGYPCHVTSFQSHLRYIIYAHASTVADQALD